MLSGNTKFNEIQPTMTITQTNYVHTITLTEDRKEKRLTIWHLILTSKHYGAHILTWKNQNGKQSQCSLFHLPQYREWANLTNRKPDALNPLYSFLYIYLLKF